ncbi:MAG TPA: thioredoxin [Vicinamibacterales bacterium]|nr:thioredoxin [Vicinamibacterales bacterium]
MASLQLDDKGLLVPCGHCGRTNRIAFDKLDHAARCGQCKEEVRAGTVPLEVSRSADFDQLVSHSAVPVVVDYWAPWCGPCRMVAPELEKVAGRGAGRFLVVKVNTDALSDLGARYAIRSIPTLAVFVGGREVTRTTGARPAPEIEAFIAQAAAAAPS